MIMVVDMHPGPQDPQTPMVVERVGEVLLDIESHLPRDLHLFQHRIFIRDVMEIWAQVQVEAMPRTWRVIKPELRQAELHQLWYQREREDSKWKH